MLVPCWNDLPVLLSKATFILQIMASKVCANQTELNTVQGQNPPFSFPTAWNKIGSLHDVLVNPSSSHGLLSIQGVQWFALSISRPSTFLR